MMLNSLYNHRGELRSATVGRAARGLGHMAKTRYPLFFWGFPLARAELPIFIYHDVSTEAFARDLEFLRVNGYRTIGLDEFMASGDRKAPNRERRVLLTFDDARSSFYDAALPTLRTFGARATLFVPSYWMSAPAPAAGGLFMSWDQVRSCAESGLVDVQSHAHRHALVPTSGNLLAFASPPLLQQYDIYDWPMRRGAGGDLLGRPQLGTPVYRAAPLLSAPRRFLENPGLTEACVRLVAESGGEAFFSRPDWVLSLHRLYASRSSVLQGEFMSEVAFAKLVESEFERTRADFLTHLGYAPGCVAYPWMLGSRRSLDLARQHGFRCAFGVAVDYRRARDQRHPLAVFGRLKSDWLPLLPGKGRASLLRLAARKAAAFSKMQPLAH
jgi:peptidoglycan/xylan/chitin deacetylase (PgdA/CDA1 family)